ncbi:MAG: YbaB/EbfC family nucleoid-associated protein [Chloroflexi bacterium]|nr:YbaB/EbfC family nucleoid-associated protein [Chloroflexota bacterium]
MAKGFNAPMGARNQGNMMAQIAKLQEQMEQAQTSLADEKVTETAGGGGVSVTMTGDQRVVEVKVQPDLLASGDTEMVEDMLLTAMNKALESSRKLHEDKMAPFTNLLSGFGMGR